MSAKADALFAAAERGIAEELVLREAMRGMPNGEERTRLETACRVLEREYERATEEAMYLRGLEQGYDLRAGSFLAEAAEPNRVIALPKQAARRDVDDWSSQEPLL